jgi:hypothetical protein
LKSGRSAIIISRPLAMSCLSNYLLDCLFLPTCLAITFCVHAGKRNRIAILDQMDLGGMQGNMLENNISQVHHY